MAKKNKIRETAIENYYDLKTDKIDELVAILQGDTPEGENPTSDIEEITGEKIESNSARKRNFDPYRRDKLSAIPVWLKALLIKWWFAGAVCWFIDIGLGAYLVDGLDTVVATGLVLLQTWSSTPFSECWNRTKRSTTRT